MKGTLTKQLPYFALLPFQPNPQYGRNIGIAFQLVDDLLDFVSTDEALGKPAAADLNLGLATAPVLFALDQHPDLAALIVRR